MVSSKAIATLFAISSLASAQDVDYDDIPSQCTQVCDPIVRLTQQCDNGRSDADQLSCVCQANNATVQLPACEACFAMFDPDGHDNDVHDLVTECSFTTTSYVPSTSTAVGGPIVTTTTQAGPTISSGEPSTTQSRTNTPSQTGSTTSQSATTSDSGSAAQDTGAAVAIAVDGMMGVLVGAAGVAAFL